MVFCFPEICRANRTPFFLLREAFPIEWMGLAAGDHYLTDFNDRFGGDPGPAGRFDDRLAAGSLVQAKGLLLINTEERDQPANVFLIIDEKV
jgi:hypothetical protein